MTELTVLADSVFIHAIGYAAIRRPGILTPARTTAPPPAANGAAGIAAAKYRTSGRTPSKGKP